LQASSNAIDRRRRAHHAEQRENHADNYEDDPDRPQDRDLGQKADDEKYYAECYHPILPR
jgi:hypothetical protein